MNCVTASEEGRGEGLGIPTAVVWQKTQRIFLEAIVMVLAGQRRGNLGAFVYLPRVRVTEVGVWRGKNSRYWM